MKRYNKNINALVFNNNARDIKTTNYGISYDIGKWHIVDIVDIENEQILVISGSYTYKGNVDNLDDIPDDISYEDYYTYNGFIYAKKSNNTLQVYIDYM